MAILPRRQSLTLPLAPAVAGVVGILVIIAILLTPRALFDTVVDHSGIAAVVSAAAPPLGLKARLAIALGAGAAIAVLGWFGLFLLFGNRSLVVQRSTAEAAPRDRAPSVRRADAHPDAPPRRPLSVSQDIAGPGEGRFGWIEPVAAAPMEIDREPFTPRPITAAEAVIPAVMAEEASGAPVDRDSAIEDIDSDFPTISSTSSERFETFELTPMVRPRIQLVEDDSAAELRGFIERGADRRQAWPLPSLVASCEPLPMGAPLNAVPVAEQPARIAPGSGSPPPRPGGASIDQLIARLERGVDRPETIVEPEPEPTTAAAVVELPVPASRPILSELDSLEQTLETLRRLSRRVG